MKTNERSGRKKEKTTMAEELEKKNANPENEGALADDDVETVAGGFTPPPINECLGRELDPIKTGDDNNR